MYGFIITHDHTEDRGCRVLGPSTIHPSIAGSLDAGEGRAFRMYDDDGNLNLSGRLIGDSEEAWFAPLGCYGLPAFGCTYIKVRNGNKWETLS